MEMDEDHWGRPEYTMRLQANLEIFLAKKKKKRWRCELNQNMNFIIEILIKMFLFKEKNKHFLHWIARSHLCLFFQEFYTITKNKQTKTLCLFHIFPVVHF